MVSYNTLELLRSCLQSLEEADEIIVVDNASSDGSPEMVSKEFPWAILIANSKNVGFGAANNLGLSAMSGDVALFLNSDAQATPGAINRLKQVMSDPQLVACGGRLVELEDWQSPGIARGQNPLGCNGALNNRTQNSCSSQLTLWVVFCEQSGLEKIFPKSRLLSPYWMTERILRSGELVTKVGQVMGACLAIRPLEKFDERYFLYVEDTDLCKRLASHGDIVYVADALFGHVLGGSSAQNRWWSVAMYNLGKETYFRIHKGRFSAGLCWLLNRCGAALRLVLWSALALVTLGRVARFRRQAELFLRVLLCPTKGPQLPADS